MRGGALLAAAAWVGLVGCAPGQTKRDLHDLPISTVEGEVTWRGRVLLDRPVVVRKGAHLTILPGTVVQFRRVDWDQDGIGDAEITVEGALTAEGTRERPILFASAEAEPRPADWKYLMVNFAEGARLSYARVRDAYSGVQVHYSPATVRNCEFLNNVDGVRFSTARLRVEGCWVHDNTNGIRFEERGHAAEVVGNEVSFNDVAVFAVTECRGNSLFRNNNFRGNRTAVKLGVDQRWDLSFDENYWSGGREGEPAGGAIVDRRVDPKLGRVTMAAELLSPAPVVVPPFPVPDDPIWRPRGARTAPPERGG